MAGKTTPCWPTMSWQAGDPVNSTHLTAAAWFLVPALIESARPLNMLARLPLGPIGSRRDADLDALERRNAGRCSSQPR